MRTGLLITAVLAALMYATPVEDMNSIIDAVYRADGETVYRSLSSENQEAVSFLVTMFQFAPEEVCEEFRSELGVQLSTSEVVNIKEEELVGIILDSPFFRNEIPWERSAISCEESPMRGDTAMVKVSIIGEPNTYTYPMVLQEGSWKLATGFFEEQ